MNPIKHLWDELERQMQVYKLLSKNRKDLWQILQKKWLNININKCQNLINNIFHWVIVIIKSKGYIIK